MRRCLGGFWLLAGLLSLTGPLPAKAGLPATEYITVQTGLPQGFIKSLVQDRRGFIWLATRDGLCRYDGVRFKIFHHNPLNPHSVSFSSIYEIRQTPQGLLWLSTEINTVDLFDPVRERSRRLSDSPGFRRALNGSTIASLTTDEQGNVWVATHTNGFFRLSPSGVISHRQWAAQAGTQPHTIRSLLIDRHGNLFIAATDGLFRYDITTGQFTAYGPAHGLPQADVFTLHERANGELMLGFPGRFAIFDASQGRVRRVVPLPSQPTRVPLFTRDQQGTDFVGLHQYTDKTGLVPMAADPKFNRFPPLSTLIDRSNVLWVGTDGDGVVKYNLNKQPFYGIPYQTNFQTDWMTHQLGIDASAIPADIRQAWPYSLRYQFDRQQQLWVSSPDTPVYRFDPSQRRFSQARPTGIPAQWLPQGSFRFLLMATGAGGELWGLLGPDGRAVARYNPDQQTFTTFPLPIPAGHPYEFMAMVADGGRVYLATRHHGLLRADLSTGRLMHWGVSPNKANTLPINSLLSLRQDPIQYNYLWIGTFGNGLCRFDKQTGRIRSFTTRDGLPNDVIYTIRPDRSGHLWLSTNRGLCRFDSRAFDAINYTTDDGLPCEEFNRFHAVTMPDGRLIFGGVSGYTVFDPQRISDDGFKPVVALTDLYINNKLVSPGTPGSPISQDINETPELVLTHLQNFLSFSFAALQFNKNTKNLYRYKLIGLDNDWVYSGNQAMASYTNLSPGTYTFVVNASNTSGVWSPQTRQIRVIIEPSPWASWWAYSAYGLLLLMAIIVFVRVRINRVRLQSRMELREQESAQLKHLDEVKSRFFANITHEFRNPLTLILTPLEQLLQSIQDPQQHNRLTIIHRNASQLLRLINELLDLAKLEAGSIGVIPTQGNLVEFVKRVVSAFDEEANRKHIRLSVTHPADQPLFWFDADKVEKILNNLLTNALKFTSKNGTVDVNLSARPATAPTDSPNEATYLVRLSVTDTGMGIAEHKLPYIFNRFYQGDQPDNQTAVGSGIGLALVKELVDVMAGTIQVESRPGAGSTFTVELPCRLVVEQSLPTVPLPQPLLVSVPAEMPDPVGSTDLPHILLVEDNDEIAEFVTEVLHEEFYIQRVSDGRSGVETAISEGPDLVISDVLMPELDGYELCRQLKANPLTSHIPIILLTARVSSDSRIEGLTAGADDYITKPFQIEDLQWRVRNRLEQLQRSRQHYRTQLLGQGHLPPVSPLPEDDFLNKVYTIIKARIDDTSFGVEPLAMAVGISRMQLNRRVKAMTGVTPIELIRAVRLNQAQTLLLTPLSISEVAYAVGFDNPAYFSKVFKDEFGLTPSDYIDQNRQRSA